MIIIKQELHNLVRIYHEIQDLFQKAKRKHLLNHYSQKLLTTLDRKVWLNIIVCHKRIHFEVINYFSSILFSR